MGLFPQALGAEPDPRVVKQLERLLMLCLGVGIPYELVQIGMTGLDQGVVNATIALLGFAVALGLLRSDRARLGALTASTALIVGITLDAWRLGGFIHYPPLLPLFVLALVFPLLLASWFEMALVVLAQVLALVVLTVSHAPLDQSPTITLSPVQSALFGAAYLCVLGGVLISAVRAFRSNVQQLDESTTALAQTRDHLALSESRFQQLVEEMPDGIVSLDATGVLIECNPAVSKISGLPREDMLGRHFSVLGQLDDLEMPLGRFDEIMADSLKSGLTEVSFVRADGTRVYVEANPKVVRHAEGSRVQVVIRDVSARHRAQAEHAALESQLREARRLEAVGRLAGGIAHDFNNLLTVIVSGAELLKSAPLSESDQELLQQVDTAAHRAAGLTEQLLAFARKQVRTPRVVDINTAVAELKALLPRLIREDIELEVRALPRAVPVWADPTQLQQILVNLVVNARDAMPEGGELGLHTSVVTVTEHDDANTAGVEPGRYGYLAVTDTGEGMDEETRRRVFEPFFSTKGNRGTGLGLATVHGLVKQSGGHVVVTTEVGTGTTFAVYLPLTDRMVTPRPAAPRALRNGKGRTVLVVDDEDLVLRTIKRVLDADGYRVLSAGSPSEAMEVSAAEPGRIDLLITDVVLPQIAGTELAEQLCATREDLRVLFTSGYTESAVVHQGVSDEGIHFLGKPFTPDGLRRKLAEVLA